MTKKILAVLLSVALVVSLLPATIFATENDCPVLDEHEGYNDHSKAHCDAHGVGYEPISTVAPECGQDGYTLYQCDCGAYFMDDIIPMDDHVSTTEPTEVVEPTCTSTGMVPVYTCDNCGDTYVLEEDVEYYADYYEVEVAANGTIAKLPHTYETEYPTNDCTASESVCDVCGAKDETHEPEEEHSWVYDDPDYYEVVKEPTYHEDGVIKFYCTNEGCSQYKAVAIKAYQPHTEGMELIEAVEPDCDSTGNIEYWKDEVCGKLFIETQEGLVEVTEEDVFLDVEHDWNVDPTIIAPTCTEWGFGYYGCPTCGATKGVTEDSEDDEVTKYPPLGHTYYECSEHGREWDPEEECEECADAKLSEQYVMTPATCKVDGSHSWICGREGCGEALSEKINMTQHDLETVTVPATCGKAYKYTFTYCTNENCTDAQGNETELKQTVEVEFEGEPLELDLTVEVREDGNVYDLDANHDGFKVIGTPTVTASDEEPVHFYIPKDTVQPNDCRNPGKEFWYCVGCNDNHPVDLPVLGHDYSDPTNDIPATCTTNAYKVCDREGCCYGPNNGPFQQEQTGTKGHKWATEKDRTTLPTCEGEKGYDIYKCTVDGCQGEDKRNAKSFVPNRTYYGREDLNLTAKQEFELEHPEFAAGLDTGATEYQEYRPGDCIEEGYWKAYCPHCDWTYLVLVDNTGRGHSFVDYVSNNDATCTEDGTETATCELCGEAEDTRTEEDSALGHAFEGNYVYNNDATCEADGTETAICGNGCETEDTRTAEDTMLPHNYADNAVEEEDECTTPGFVHYECTLGCGSEYVDGYIDEVEHVEDDPITTYPSCTEDGSIVINCEICGDELSSETLPATGHKNAAGETIEDKCTDTVTDRVCVNDDAEEHAGCPLTANNDGDKVVGKSHDIEQITVEPGCEHYGYYAETCANGCGEKDLITNIIDPVGHYAPWGESYFAGKEAEEIIDEDICGWYGEEFLYWGEDYQGPITAYTAPTYESLGSITFICSNDDCGDEITRDVIRTGVDFIIEADNAAVSGAEITDGDVISYEITLNAYQTNIWGFNFDVYYNAASMNFLGYTYNAGDVFANYKVNNITEDELIYEFDVEGYDVNGNSINDLYGIAEDMEGTIKVSAYTENDIDGNAADALVNGTLSVITLYFQVEAKFDYTFMGVPGYEYDYEIFADMEYDDGYGWVSSATVVNSEGEVENEADWVYDEAGIMLDINYSGDVTITDLYFCNQILTGESEYEYLASADANKDGQITITDLDLMNQLLQGADESVIYEALEWTAPEGFVAA